MKNNKELKYTIPKKAKLTKKNYIIIIIPIILILTITGFIMYLSFFYLTPNQKLKRYLEKNNYKCNKSVCYHKENNTITSINYQNATMTVDSPNYEIFIESSTPIVYIKDSDKSCKYTKLNSAFLSKIDDSYTYSNDCQKYLNDVNVYIVYYQDVLTNSHVDVNQILK